MLEFYFFAKILVLIFLWVFILLCLSIIVFSRKIYIALRNSEIAFNQGVRAALTSFSPFLGELSAYNSTFQKLIGARKITSSDIFSLTKPFLIGKYNIFKGFKMGLALTKSLLSKS
jgi:hypothetical protein